jgi:hypothetical protein
MRRAISAVASLARLIRSRPSHPRTPAAPTRGTNATVTGPEANTLYDLRIAAAAPAATDAQPAFSRWTTIAVSTTGSGAPKWLDLVVESDGCKEIDVTRVQELFFTVVVAAFVSMRVFSAGEIPTIADGFLLLMGNGDGVYLSAKFIPS